MPGSKARPDDPASLCGCTTVRGIKPAFFMAIGTELCFPITKWYCKLSWPVGLRGSDEPLVCLVFVQGRVPADEAELEVPGGGAAEGVPIPTTSQPSEAVSQGNGKQPIIIVADRHGHDRSGYNWLPHAPNQNSISGTRTNVLNSLFASIWRYGTGTGTDIYMITDMDMSDRNIMMNDYIYFF